MDPKHLINTYLCVFSLSALVLTSASALLQYKTSHQENCNKKHKDPLSTKMIGQILPIPWYTKFK